MSNVARWTPEQLAEYERRVGRPLLTAAPKVESAPLLPGEKRPNAGKGPGAKYGNTIVEHEGITFHSKKERDRYVVLKRWQGQGIIGALELQRSFDLIPKQVINGKTYKAIRYVADFVYVRDGKPVVEDSKGFKTREYGIKLRLMKLVHGIEVQES